MMTTDRPAAPVAHEARTPWMATDGKTCRGRCTCGWEGSNMSRPQAIKRTEQHIRNTQGR